MNVRWVRRLRRVCWLLWRRFWMLLEEPPPPNSESFVEYQATANEFPHSISTGSLIAFGTEFEATNARPIYSPISSFSGLVGEGVSGAEVGTSDSGIRLEATPSRNSSHNPGRDGSSSKDWYPAEFWNRQPVSDSVTHVNDNTAAIANAASASPKPSTLRDRLWKAERESPPHSLIFFVPDDDLERLVNPNSVEAELGRSNFKFKSGEVRKNMAVRISATSRRLFAILVCLQLESLIFQFLAEGIDDSHLPFVRSHETGQTQTFKFCSRLHPEQPIKCMEHWEQDRVHSFGRTQWFMLAPIFDYTDDIKHYELEDNCVLPFVTDRERCNNNTTEGGYGSVSKVCIHPAHQRGPNGSVTSVRVIALKELHSQDSKCFNSEVAMLKTFRSSSHAHLIKLLATYRWRGKYYLMFPYARSNLREYWQITPLPDFSESTIIWFLDQCKALASALHYVHEYQTTHPYPILDQSTSVGNSAGGREDDRKYGRHGDIKPENILWFAQEESGSSDDKGHLVIADFGLTDLHKRATRSEVPAGHITGSPTYEPPELILHWTISRAYDIWSLGCVFLEFVTWLVRGSEVLDRFPEARGKVKDNVDDDTFFSILGDEAPGAPREAIVREGVREWIARLREQPRSSTFVLDFLDLVSNHMLEVDPTSRIKCALLNRKLREMQQKAQRTPGYLTNRIISHHSSGQLHAMDLPRLDPIDGNPSPSATEGTPLPTQPSGSIESRLMEHSSPQIQPLILANMSPPSSPKLGSPAWGR